MAMAIRCWFLWVVVADLCFVLLWAAALKFGVILLDAPLPSSVTSKHPIVCRIVVPSIDLGVVCGSSLDKLAPLPGLADAPALLAATFRHVIRNEADEQSSRAFSQMEVPFYFPAAEEILSSDYKVWRRHDSCDPPLSLGPEGIYSRPCDWTVSCVLSANVCIGGQVGAFYYEGLDAANVTHVISAIGMCPERTDGRPCLNLDLKDTNGELGIVEGLRRARDWAAPGAHTADGRPTRIFVHCAAGMSRSAAIVLMYMMDADAGLTYDTALAQLRRARPVARPNPLFELVLRLLHDVRDWEETACGVAFALARGGDVPRCTVSTHAALIEIYKRHKHKLPPFPELPVA